MTGKCKKSEKGNPTRNTWNVEWKQNEKMCSRSSSVGKWSMEKENINKKKDVKWKLRSQRGSPKIPYSIVAHSINDKIALIIADPEKYKNSPGKSTEEMVLVKLFV